MLPLGATLGATGHTLAAEQSPGRRLRRRSFVAFEQVSVTVLSNGNAGMPEYLRDHMQRRALGQTGEAPEWRSSCGCQWPSPARSPSRTKECEKLSGSIGVPTSLAKMSP